jgi:hypothetical protein
MLKIVKLNTDVLSSPLPRRMTIAIQSTHLHTRNPVLLNPTLSRKPFISIPATETLFHLFDCTELVRNSLRRRPILNLIGTSTRKEFAPETRRWFWALPKCSIKCKLDSRWVFMEMGGGCRCRL